MSIVLHDILIEELSELFAIEAEQVEMLPKLAEAASSEELRKGFQQHLEATRRQQDRLKRIFEMLDEEPITEVPETSQELATEAEDKMGRDADNEIVDLMLLGAARKVEHMEIAGYEMARAIANALELKEVVALLDETLHEEQQTDRMLSQAAKPLLEVAAEAQDDLELEEVDEEAEIDINPDSQAA